MAEYKTVLGHDLKRRRVFTAEQINQLIAEKRWQQARASIDVDGAHVEDLCSMTLQFSRHQVIHLQRSCFLRGLSVSGTEIPSSEESEGTEESDILASETSSLQLLDVASPKVCITGAFDGVDIANCRIGLLELDNVQISQLIIYKDSQIDTMTFRRAAVDVGPSFVNARVNKLSVHVSKLPQMKATQFELVEQASTDSLPLAQLLRVLFPRIQINFCGVP